MSPGEVVVTIDRAGVAEVRLNRPEKHNALSPAVFEGLVAAGDALKANASVRAVVLSGQGESFCAGLDKGLFLAAAGDGVARKQVAAIVEPRDQTHTGQQAAWVWREIPVPVVAAIHGVCYGGGIQIALAADLRIAAPDARLSVREITWGLTPDMTGTITLPAIVRPDVAIDLAMTGRVVSGVEAERIGLVTRTADEPRAAALALAAEVAQRNPDAIRALKSLLCPDRRAIPVAQRFEDERSAIRRLALSSNAAEAVRAQFEGRAPEFVDACPTD